MQNFFERLGKEFNANSEQIISFIAKALTLVGVKTLMANKQYLKSPTSTAVFETIELRVHALTGPGSHEAAIASANSLPIKNVTIKFDASLVLAKNPQFTAVKGFVFKPRKGDLTIKGPDLKTGECAALNPKTKNLNTHKISLEKDRAHCISAGGNWVSEVNFPHTLGIPSKGEDHAFMFLAHFSTADSTY